VSREPNIRHPNKDQNTKKTRKKITSNRHANETEVNYAAPGGIENEKHRQTMQK
jgi:hypothetical protein